MTKKSPPTGAGFSLKDQLFNRARVQYLADLFLIADADFDADGFVREAMTGLKALELKARIVHIAMVLERYLAADFPTAAQQIVAALPPPLDPNLTDDDFGDFIFAPLGQVVVHKGLAKPHLRIALDTLKEITQRFSMEDAIRAFITAHPTATLAELKRWSTDRNYHVRRLVSEGTRPLLPWSGRLSIAPSVPLPLLDTLHSDTTRYVTRSVANHLNDLSKSNAELVLHTLQRWKREARQDASELQWINRHALRTLVKRGHAPALEFLGFASTPAIDVSGLSITSTRVRPGDALEFSFTVVARQDEQLVVDYLIEFLKANGTLSPKVHKLKQIRLGKGEAVTIRKRHVLRANATTYTLYPGIHHVTLQINGQAFGRLSFEVLPYS